MTRAWCAWRETVLEGDGASDSPGNSWARLLIAVGLGVACLGSCIASGYDG